jgi:hypothetical protein
MGIAAVMRGLVQALVMQQHMQRSRVALSLLLNCPPQHSSTACHAHCATAGRKSCLVTDHLLAWVLQPADLASDALIMPLLQSLDVAAASQAAGSSTSNSTSTSASDSDSGALASTTQLLGACSPSQRCLEALLRTVQAQPGAVLQPHTRRAGAPHCLCAQGIWPQQHQQPVRCAGQGRQQEGTSSSRWRR